jgi:hypothetical protein
MAASDAALLDALAACIGADVPLDGALARIEGTGHEAARWVRAVRACVRPGAKVEDTLRAAGVVDDGEHALLACAELPAAIGATLAAVALRRRRREELHREVLRGLGAPFALAVATVMLDPLLGFVEGGSYFGRFFGEGLVLAVVSLAVVGGLRVLMRSESARRRFLATLARLPLLSALAARHAEADLVTLASPFVAGRGVEMKGVLVAADILAWSPLGPTLRAAALVSGTTPEWAVVRVAPRLTQETNLAVVSGIASADLPARLAARAGALSADVARRTRWLARMAAFGVVLVLSAVSFAQMASRAPSFDSLVGGKTDDEKEIERLFGNSEDLLRELNGAEPPSKPAKSAK